jgi:polyketide biosynthesis 3-hydroxy-3-methylglutaryl-CoA synthase-like enzyme PksG
VNSTQVGIEGLSAFCGLAQIPAATLAEGRELDLRRVAKLMMERRSVQLPFEDPVTNAVNAARPLTGALTTAECDRIELLVTATESGLDYSKSIASYVHRYLGLSRNCRFLEVKQACYATTGILQLAVGYLASCASPGAKALIIATDVTLVGGELPYAELATGHGAVAILVSDQPAIMTLDPGAFGSYSFEVFDTARPTPVAELWDADTSLLCYLDCLAGSFANYRSRRPESDFGGFDYLVMHTPFAGMVKAAHRKMMREHLTAEPAAVAEDFARRVAPSLRLPAQVGNLASGSLYLALASLMVAGEPLAGARVGLYSYGSGCASEFFSGVIQPGAAEALKPARIYERLAGRRELSFAEYLTISAQTRDCLSPIPDRGIDLTDCPKWTEPVLGAGTGLALAGVRRYRRTYEWQ